MNAPLEFPIIDDSVPVEVAAEVVDRADIKDGKPLVKYSRTELALADLRDKYAGKIFDLTTTKGDKEARAARLELVTLRTGLERKRKELKAPALEIGKTIDTEAARITKEIEALETPIDTQIKADEKRRAEEAARKAAGEAFRVALHKALLDRINGYARDAVGLPAERIAKGVVFVEGLTFGEETQELRSQYESAKTDTLASLRKLHSDAVTAEAEAAERERQRIENERVAAELEAQRKALEEAQAALAAQAAEVEAQRIATARAAVAAIRFPEPEPVVEVASANPPAVPDTVLPVAPDASVAEFHESATAAFTAIKDAEKAGAIEPAVAQRFTNLAASLVAEEAISRAQAPVTLITTTVLGEHLGLEVKGDLIASLGFSSVKQSKPGTYWKESDVPAIRAALVKHITHHRRTPKEAA
jgi:hypothetical protein